MIDYRLKVFRAVATNFSFSKAAQELFISQPAVSKHIQELETEYKTQLFDRTGNHITLTTAGQLLFDHSTTILNEYKKMDYAMNTLRNKHKGTLNIGVSTSIAHYVIPEIVLDFIKQYPELEISGHTSNSAIVESRLIAGKIDIGLVENCHKHSKLKYTRFMKDELVAIARTSLRIKDEITLDELSKLPLILREHGSGTLEVIEHYLSQKGYSLSKMNVLLHFSTTEIIKRIVEKSDNIGIVSVRSLQRELREGTLKIIDIKGMEMSRDFMFVEKQGIKGGTNKLLKDFITSRYKQ